MEQAGGRVTGGDAKGAVEQRGGGDGEEGAGHGLERCAGTVGEEGGEFLEECGSGVSRGVRKYMGT